MSETYTNSEVGDTVSAYATLRFCGDLLDPERVTAALRTTPTLAYRKGEVYRRTQSGHATRGRTGVWLLSTRGSLPGHELADHLHYLASLLSPAVREAARQIMRADALDADVSCFWHGKAGAMEPPIPSDVVAVFGELPAPIEIDFDTD